MNVFVVISYKVEYKLILGIKKVCSVTSADRLKNRYYVVEINLTVKVYVCKTSFNGNLVAVRIGLANDAPSDDSSIHNVYAVI